MFLLALLACANTSTGSDTETSDTDPRTDAQRQDDLVDELAGYRTEFLDEEADELWTDGAQLFWLTFPGYDPVLHRWDPSSDTTVDYDFSIGSDVYTYAASDALVVSPEVTSSKNHFRAYALDDPENLVDSWEIDKPTDGSRWHAYAVDGDTVYVCRVTWDETAMYAWQPPGDPERLWSFEELGYELGTLQAFGVDDGTLVFIEGGRIWRGDVATGVAEWLENETQVVGGDVNFDAHGVTWVGGEGAIYHFDMDAGPSAVNVTYTMNTSGYELDGYTSVHQTVEDGYWRVGDTLVYEASAGLFAYDLATLEFEPLVLVDSDADIRVTWRDPVLLDDGTLFATGLESASGSVGAEGPVWKIEHPALTR